MNTNYEILIVGSGAAGVAAALEAAQYAAAHERRIRIGVLERSTRLERGGNTRWTSGYLRCQENRQPADRFLEDFALFGAGQCDQEYVKVLHKEAANTLSWLEDNGVHLENQPNYFLSSTRPRLAIAGGGLALVETFTAQAERLGVEFLYETKMLDLITGDAGVCGVNAAYQGENISIRSQAVILASGGFEGDSDLREQYFGSEGKELPTVARGGQFNKGDGILAAMKLGAATSGEWENFHCEPVDPRSHLPEAVTMMFPYGLLLNSDAVRFVDEAAGTVDEIYEDVTRAIFHQPGNFAYLVGDQQLMEIPDWQRAMLTDREPYRADSLTSLAEILDLDPTTFCATIGAYNDAVFDNRAGFDPMRPDGLRTKPSLQPPKSNWSRPINTAPFVAWPVKCSIVFTFGGLDTDTSCRVIDASRRPIPYLFAAGEIHGLYHKKYPGATSVLRSLVFGRIAGRVAAETVAV